MPASRLLTAAAACLLALCLPEAAYAWGPGTHLQIGTQILDHVAVLAPALQELLRRHPADFLYGCIGADITVGKKYLIEQGHHCHNWSMGFRLLDAAESSHERAFAYGYLCHLAADTVSHNYYVPYQTVAAFRTTTLRHTYWEVRFDDFVDRRIWPLARAVHDEAHARNDGLLQRVLLDTLFSFRTNKRIFTGLLTLQQLRQWRRMIRLLAERSAFPLTRDDFDHFYRLALDASVAFLVDGPRSRPCRLDPIGREALETAARLRKALRHLSRRRRLPAAVCDELVREVRRALRAELERGG
ncbi:MAG TPA: zinc dependent phospholipase C family protein, partial [Thermodesulfobacteriota bacterium]|nr:zinc dependent phospholipase C family protein [Thermodesulfobacteriota bacterium]